MVQENFISGISVYALKYGLDDDQKGNFYDSLISVVTKFWKKEIVFSAGDFLGHA